MKVFLIGVVVGVVAISVIIPTVYFSDYQSEILTALIAGAVCGMPSIGIVIGWLLTTKTVQESAYLVGAADRGYAAQMGRDREGIRILGRSPVNGSQPPAPAFGPGAGQPWLPPLGDFDIVEGESQEIERG